MATAKRKVDTSTVMKLAVEAQLDERTVCRAIDKGVDALRSGFAKERLRAAAKKFGIAL